MPRRRRRSIFTSLLMLGLMLACLAVAGFFLVVEAAPRLAEADFGPPASGMEKLPRAVYALQMLLARDAILRPVDPNGVPSSFEIKQNDPVDAIASKLLVRDLIRDAGAFRLYLIYSGLDKTIKPGIYQISPAQNAMEIGKAIQDPAPSLADLRILPGWRLEEVAAALPFTGLTVKPQEFLNAARTYALPAGLAGAGGTGGVEGFLFPGSFKLARGATPGAILDAVVGGFIEQLSPEIQAGFRSQGLNVVEGVTLASLVQREAMVEAEQPTIASVFLNRLNNGMKLESDPTVQYALGYLAEQKTWWKNPLSLDDLKIKSPYNTYMNSGLPPRPICSPGLAALRAVAFPAQTDYFYFRARCDGSGTHAFSETFDEHLNNACP